MSEVALGRVTDLVPKKTKDYFGVQLSNHRWINVEGDFDESLKNEKVAVVLNDNGFGTDIRRIQDSPGNSKSAHGGGGDVSASKTSRIVAQGAVNLAVDNADTKFSEDQEKHLAEVRKRSSEYSKMIEDLSSEVENRGENQ